MSLQSLKETKATLEAEYDHLVSTFDTVHFQPFSEQFALFKQLKALISDASSSSSSGDKTSQADLQSQINSIQGELKQKRTAMQHNRTYCDDLLKRINTLRHQIEAFQTQESSMGVVSVLDAPVKSAGMFIASGSSSSMPEAQVEAVEAQEAIERTQSNAADAAAKAHRVLHHSTKRLLARIRRGDQSATTKPPNEPDDGDMELKAAMEKATRERDRVAAASSKTHESSTSKKKKTKKPSADTLSPVESSKHTAVPTAPPVRAMLGKRKDSTRNEDDEDYELEFLQERTTLMYEIAVSTKFASKYISDGHRVPKAKGLPSIKKDRPKKGAPTFAITDDAFPPSNWDDTWLPPVRFNSKLNTWKQYKLAMRAMTHRLHVLRKERIPFYTTASTNARSLVAALQSRSFTHAIQQYGADAHRHALQVYNAGISTDETKTRLFKILKPMITKLFMSWTKGNQKTYENKYLKFLLNISADETFSAQLVKSSVNIKYNWTQIMEEYVFKADSQDVQCVCFSLPTDATDDPLQNALEGICEPDLLESVYATCAKERMRERSSRKKKAGAADSKSKRSVISSRDIQNQIIAQLKAHHDNCALVNKKLVKHVKKGKDTLKEYPNQQCITRILSQLNTPSIGASFNTLIWDKKTHKVILCLWGKNECYGKLSYAYYVHIHSSESENKPPILAYNVNEKSKDTLRRYTESVFEYLGHMTNPQSQGGRQHTIRYELFFVTDIKRHKGTLIDTTGSICLRIHKTTSTDIVHILDLYFEQQNALLYAPISYSYLESFLVKKERVHDIMHRLAQTMLRITNRDLWNINTQLRTQITNARSRINDQNKIDDAINNLSAQACQEFLVNAMCFDTFNTCARSLMDNREVTTLGYIYGDEQVVVAAPQRAARPGAKKDDVGGGGGGDGSGSGSDGSGSDGSDSSDSSSSDDEEDAEGGGVATEARSDPPPPLPLPVDKPRRKPLIPPPSDNAEEEEETAPEKMIEDTSTIPADNLIDPSLMSHAAFVDPADAMKSIDYDVRDTLALPDHPLSTARPAAYDVWGADNEVGSGPAREASFGMAAESPFLEDLSSGNAWMALAAHAGAEDDNWLESSMIGSSTASDQMHYGGFGRLGDVDSLSFPMGDASSSSLFAEPGTPFLRYPEAPSGEGYREGFL